MNTKKNIDLDLINPVAREITDRFKLILKIFPKEKEHLLRNLASCSIHLSLFLRDINNHVFGDDVMHVDDMLEDDFLKQCGCNIKK